ncbi:hypothetical protein BJY00DRAFT_315918 [Aspergillus carlsbadensis]|nr:hypothetical protein BJY00DRAFT_315918 [Aspergillus carlsbadensis]
MPPKRKRPPSLPLRTLASTRPRRSITLQQNASPIDTSALEDTQTETEAVESKAKETDKVEENRPGVDARPRCIVTLRFTRLRAAAAAAADTSGALMSEALVEKNCKSDDESPRPVKRSRRSLPVVEVQIQSRAEAETEAEPETQGDASVNDNCTEFSNAPHSSKAKSKIYSPRFPLKANYRQVQVQAQRQT